MQSKERLEILSKIEEYEKLGLWDKDVEPDPETVPLNPEDVDYLGEKLSSRIKTKFANRQAIKFFEKGIKSGDYAVDGIVGLENFTAVSGGALITCNHISVFDHYAVYRAIRPQLKKGHELYKIIREGNYNMPGIFGFFLKNCNTLPLSKNVSTMKKFLKSLSVLLERGEKVLVYPEQSMWWNYKKPRPLKDGAFRFAVKNKVPVIPCFLTMRDTDKLDNDGFNVQALKVNFAPAIYMDESLSEKENIQLMRDKNYQAFVEIYEKNYGIKLEYKKD